MKTFTVTIPEQWRKAFGAERQVEADYAIVRDGALIFMEVSEVPGDLGETGYISFHAGGHVRGQPQVMVNEFPAGFWDEVTPEPREWEDELAERRKGSAP